MCEWTKTNYLTSYYGQTPEVNEDVTDRNQDGLTGLRKGCRNWLVAAQNRGRWRHLLEKAEANPGL